MNDCSHEYESYGIIDTERDYYGERYLIGYQCVLCDKEFTEWTYEK